MPDCPVAVGRIALYVGWRYAWGPNSMLNSSAPGVLGRLVWHTDTRDHTASKDKHGTHSTITSRSQRLGAAIPMVSPEP